MAAVFHALGSQSRDHNMATWVNSTRNTSWEEVHRVLFSQNPSPVLWIYPHNWIISFHCIGFLSKLSLSAKETLFDQSVFVTNIIILLSDAAQT